MHAFSLLCTYIYIYARNCIKKCSVITESLGTLCTLSSSASHYRYIYIYINSLCKRDILVVLLVEVDEGLAVFVEICQLDGPQQIALAVDGTETVEREKLYIKSTSRVYKSLRAQSSQRRLVYIVY